MTEIILIVLVILAVFWLYFVDRNEKVFLFSVNLNHFLHEELERILKTYKDDDEFHKDKNNYYNIREKVYYLLDKHSYSKYLFSFKPLKLEKWFTKEDLEFITYLKQYRK